MHTFSADKKQKIIDLKLSYKYSDANFLYFKELLNEYEKINISYSSLHNILSDAGIKSPKKHRKKKHPSPRERKHQFGELVQTDATPYPWFSDGVFYSLHGYIDDATGEILGLYMCKNECLLGYLEITRQMLTTYGAPQAIYSDKYSVFFPAKTAKNKLSIDEQLDGKTEATTQFYRILDELGTQLIAASTSQAKGRIERLWETLQGRLVTEFRIHNISTPDEANDFFTKYIKRFNKKFSIEAKDKKSLFVKPPAYINLDMLLTNKLTRKISKAGTISINRKLFQIVGNDIKRSTTINIYISHRIGIVAEYNDKIYKVIPHDNIPAKTTTQAYEMAYEYSKTEIMNYALAFCSINSKRNEPTLTSY